MTAMKPFERTVAKKDLKLFPNETSLEEYKQATNSSRLLGVLVVFLYRHTPDMDHLHYYVKDPPENYPEEIVEYDSLELLTWLGGVALTSERERILGHSNRKHGSFADNFGWNPLVCVKDAPTDSERDVYVGYEMSMVDDELYQMFDRGTEDGA